MPVAYVVPVYGDQADDVRLAQVASARSLATRTGARLLLRAEEPDIPEWAPNDWAGECARRAGFFGPPAEELEMIPGRALNRPAAGEALAWPTERRRARSGGQGPSWLLRFAKRYRRLRPGERLHLPAPEPGEDGAEAIAFWEACVLAEVGRRFDVVDVRATTDEQVRTLPRLAHERFGLPVVLTEWEWVDPALVVAEARAHSWLGRAHLFVPDRGPAVETD